ncbi:m-AAA protease-interacting protein 1, mitochondrial isoform X2 [Austrofundulus limnaeus]|uniref:M-AAA protease-interacting protein 1, mitochondrial isoform X2 n=1 Tax=Austrofundulus limnaeus TaxID=52670 RepID=A0A2I4BZY3_AUSLI|nr:PREDICTED: uncharacterized protein C2orf47 homolog, mitochondrial isoform X2 [Austrofundulus limnaeus]
MALSLLRCHSRLNSAFSFTRLVLNQNVALARFCRTRPGASITAGRLYSSQKKLSKVVVFSFTNPLLWFRTRVYYLLIKAYFDKDFSIKEFTEGATQSQFEALNGLVAEDLIGKLEQQWSSLPPSCKKALSAGPEGIVSTTLRDVGIFYDNDRKFVRILMHFWYLASASLPEDLALNGVHVSAGTDDEEPKRLRCAIYEFQREFTQGVAPVWTITRIEYSKLLS